MAGDKVSTVAKPNLRGLLAGQIKRNLIVAIVLGTIAGFSQHFLYNNARKEKYANFYKNYDINAEFERIRKKGLFDSC